MAIDTWDFFKDAKGEWRWRVTAFDGKIVGSSKKGFESKADCINDAKLNGYTD